jgi:hypothetical protein
MEQFNIWGQVQEVAGGRYLVIAMACPLESGRQTSFSKVVPHRDDAEAALESLIDQLQRQLASAGDSVVGVHQLEGHMPSNDFPPRGSERAPAERRRSAP